MIKNSIFLIFSDEIRISVAAFHQARFGQNDHYSVELNHHLDGQDNVDLFVQFGRGCGWTDGDDGLGARFDRGTEVSYESI